MNFLTILAAVMRVAKVALPAIEAELGSKAGGIAAAAGAVASTAADAVAAKGSPASVSAVTAAVATVASTAGLSSNDKATADNLAEAVTMAAPMLGLMAGAMEPKHVDAINTGLAYALAFANGVTGGLAPTEPTPTP